MFTTRPELVGTFGVVATTHWLASAAGMAVAGERRQRLRRGGGRRLRAADRRAASERPGRRSADPALRRRAPSEPRRALRPGRRPGRRHHRGTTAAWGSTSCPAPACSPPSCPARSTPGCCCCATTAPGAARRAGAGDRLRRATASRCCRGSPRRSRAVAEFFTEDWPTSAAIWLPGRRGAAAGHAVPQPRARRDLPADPRRGRGGRRRPGGADRARPARPFYRGFVAEAIDELLPDRRGHGRHGRGARGPAHRRGPRRLAGHLRGAARPTTTTATPCARPGRGGRARCFLQQLALLKGFDLDGHGPAGADFVHTVIEARSSPSPTARPITATRISSTCRSTSCSPTAYNAERRALIGDTAVAASCGPGRPATRAGRPRWPRAPPAGRGAPGAASAPASRPWPLRRARSAATPCHIDVVDRSATWSRRRPPAAGCRARRSSRSSASASAPAPRCSGWSEGLPTRLAPGKRPRTTLTPSLALRDGEPYLAFGTPGGDQQDQWQLIFFLRHVHHGTEPAGGDRPAAVPHGALPGSFYPRASRPGSLAVEANLPSATIEQLQQKGHNVEVMPDGRSAVYARHPVKTA